MFVVLCVFVSYTYRYIYVWFLVFVSLLFLLSPCVLFVCVCVLVCFFFFFFFFSVCWLCSVFVFICCFANCTGLRPKRQCVCACFVCLFARCLWVHACPLLRGLHGKTKTHPLLFASDCLLILCVICRGAAPKNAPVCLLSRVEQVRHGAHPGQQRGGGVSNPVIGGSIDILCWVGQRWSTLVLGVSFEAHYMF